MAELTPAEILDLRAKLIDLELRAKQDEELMRSLQDDPVGSLRAQGFSQLDTDRIAPLFASDMIPEPIICDGITCWITTCHFWTAF